MSNTKIHFAGIELKNPIIVGSCNLSTEKKYLLRMQEAGAAAVVYKSLFEEQIQLEWLQMHDALTQYNERHAEMIQLFPNIEHAGPRQYLISLREAVETLQIPVIASINAVSSDTWVEYAAQVAQTGVAAIELNIYHAVDNFDLTEEDIISQQEEIIRKIVSLIQIPLIVKISPFYTNVLRVLKRFESAGARGFVLFNRLFQPDIDVEQQKHHFPYNLSNPEDNRLPLRYAGLLYGQTNASICASGGIMNGADVIKMILAGADAVQVVSVLYKQKIDVIASMLHQIEDWMNRHQVNSLDEIRGKLSAKNEKDHFAYKRAQYIDILMKSQEIFVKYPLP